jgi:bifunctional DNA-binding transcriptional regulator/antitoxin component of YhaV-PrlF toxin-antitoxin module
MRDSIVQLRQRGVLTLPRKLREKYGLEEGDPLTIVDLEGMLLLNPKPSVLPKLAAEFDRLRRKAGVSVKDLMDGLPRQRKAQRARDKQRAAG